MASPRPEGAIEPLSLKPNQQTGRHPAFLIINHQTKETNMTTQTTEIPLNKLVPFAGNVRKTQNKRFIAELAASIRAHGLQQNLVVKPEGRKYAVVAGGQRLKALMQLAKEGDIKPNYL